MEKMRKSLAGIELSTRAKNVLVNLSAYWNKVHSWDELIDAYKQDPTEVETQLLRTPGAGRMTVNEILNTVKPDLKGIDSTGRVIWLTKDQWKEMKGLMNRLLDGKTPDLVDRNTLLAMQSMLNARTIHTPR